MSGWAVVALGSICQIINGGTPKSEVVKYWGGSNQWITPKDMGKLQSKFVEETERQITDAGLQNCSTKLSPPKSVILSSRAPIGHLAINLRPMATNQGCKTLIPSATLDFLYLYYFLSHSKQLLNDLGSGTTFKELSSSKLSEVPIPLPPLAIQKAIVAKLDAAFVSIDTAIAAAEKNAENAKQLFQSYLSDVFEKGGEGWEEKKLSEITTKIGSGATPRGGDASYKPSGIPLIRSLNIYDDGFHYRKLAFLDEEQADALSNVIVEENDVLLNITGASIARCCVPPADVLPARVNQHVSIIRPISNAILPKFLQYLLTSNFYKSSLLKVGEGSGATRQALTKSQLQNFIVSFPRSLQKQSELITALFEVETLSKKIMEMYEGKSLAYNELKQSLLQQAFSGQLVDA